MPMSNFWFVVSLKKNSWHLNCKTKSEACTVSVALSQNLPFGFAEQCKCLIKASDWRIQRVVGAAGGWIVTKLFENRYKRGYQILSLMYKNRKTLQNIISHDVLNFKMVIDGRQLDVLNLCFSYLSFLSAIMSNDNWYIVCEANIQKSRLKSVPIWIFLQ